MKKLIAVAVGKAIALSAHLLTSVRGFWEGTAPSPETRVYFANHRSHGDFVLIWAVLPPQLRKNARPVAAADYWLSSRVRRFIIADVFNGIAIEREAADRQVCPIAQMAQVLDLHQSLILFPEGTRHAGGGDLLPFRSGLFHLAKARPEVALVPVWIENLNRVLPKGEILPVPIACTVTFGKDLHVEPDETKDAFLARAAAALIATRPDAKATE